MAHLPYIPSKNRLQSKPFHFTQKITKTEAENPAKDKLNIVKKKNAIYVLLPAETTVIQISPIICIVPGLKNGLEQIWIWRTNNTNRIGTKWKKRKRKKKTVQHLKVTNFRFDFDDCNARVCVFVCFRQRFQSGDFLSYYPNKLPKALWLAADSRVGPRGTPSVPGNYRSDRVHLQSN